MKQKLWLISELFPPEETSTGYIMGEIANVLAQKYDVTVICGPAIYDKNKKIDTNSKFKLDEQISLIRVNAVSENKSSKISRIKKFLLMSYRLYKVAHKSIRKSDKVFMVSNPFPLILMMGYLRTVRCFELVMLVHDVFPESLYTDIKLPGVVYKGMSFIFNIAYACVDKMISLGRDMTVVMSRKVKNGSNRFFKHHTQIVQIENWGDTVSIVPQGLSEPLTADKIVIEYAGNIGRAQGISKFVSTLNKVNNNHLSFCIWGTGTETEIIRQYIKLHHIDNIFLNGPYFRSQQSEVLNACDLSLITLVDGMYGLGVPSKSYNIMAAGKAILFIGALDSEIALTIRDNNIGYCFDSADAEGLERFLHGLDPNKKDELLEMGKRARRLVEERYSKEVILQKFVDTV